MHFLLLGDNGRQPSVQHGYHRMFFRLEGILVEIKIMILVSMMVTVVVMTMVMTMVVMLMLMLLLVGFVYGS